MRSLTWQMSLIFLASISTVSKAEEPLKKPDITWPGMTKAGKVLLPNGWSLKPAGKQSRLGDFPVAIIEHPSQAVLAVLHAGYGEHEVMTLDSATQKILGRVIIPETYGGIAWSPDGKSLYVGGGFNDVIYRFDYLGGLLSNLTEITYPDRAAFLKARPAGFGEPIQGQRTPAGLAVSADGETLYVANAFSHTLAVFDLPGGRLKSEVKLGDKVYPYGLCLDEGNERIYVSLWGASKVAIVDTKVNSLLGTYQTQEHPNVMLTAKKGDFLYVANANRNTVTVIDTHKGEAIETINTAIAPDAPAGSTPNALALSPDENALFVANANTNDIAVFNVKEPGVSAPLGFIPVGWYPTAIRIDKTGKTLFVANGKGGSSKPNREGPNPLVGERDVTREYIGGLFQGSLSTIPMPGPAEMAAYSKIVYDCSPLKSAQPQTITGNPIPNKVGEPSPITHCIYIIKENRTYDQVFGDLPQGNGEASLCLFPENVTPNHHKLVREFVLLDNFYVDSEVSADGHEWSMGAYATDFVEKTWPLSYRGDRKVPYPAEANFLNLAQPAGGYLWDRAKAKNVTYRSYGEFITNGLTPNDPSFTKVEALQGHFDPKFRGYDLNVQDQKRADRFLEELAGFDAKGEMPRLIILRLPNDHTSASRPGSPTPTAMVADNDLALGRVVEGLSKSRFWKSLAIFVVEDDAQNGSDHVDAHRTVALAISPYIKKKSVDSTMYSTSSMLRTMGLILGLDPMSQFDAAAKPMYNAFTNEPDLAPYVARPANVNIEEINLRTAWGAEKSMKLDLDEAEDRADDLVFNEIIWKSVKGPKSVMPPPVRAAFILPRD